MPDLAVSEWARLDRDGRRPVGESGECRLQDPWSRRVDGQLVLLPGHRATIGADCVVDKRAVEVDGHAWMRSGEVAAA